jgi:ABC-type glycerol-3-phosphate transport system substrate-binding protein
MKKDIMVICTVLILVLSGASLFGAGVQEMAPEGEQSLSVLVYITGVMAGSPPYTALGEGAQEFAAEHESVTVKI